MLDDLQRADRIELGATERARDPHAVEAFAVQGLDHRVCQPSMLVAVLGVFARERPDSRCPCREIDDRLSHTGTDRFLSNLLSQRAKVKGQRLGQRWRSKVEVSPFAICPLTYGLPLF